MPALHALVCVHNHVVAQIVKTKLTVSAISNVGGIGIMPFISVHAVLQTTHTHAQKAIDPAHPLTVTLGQVVIHGNNMNALGWNSV